MDDMIRLSQRFIRICYERCFLKDRTVPLHRSMMTMLNLALQFSTLFSKFIRDQERQRRKLHEQEQQQQSADVNHVTRSGRRTSFNILKLQRPGYEREELSSSDSDEFSEEEENEEEREERMDQDEDMDLDENEGGLQRNKKQKMGSDPLAVSTRLSHISTGGALSSSSVAEASLLQGAELRKRTHSGLPTTGTGSSFSPSTPSSPAPSYREQLESLEQEFDRCRAFLAKSLKVVVNANAARGYGSGKSPTAPSTLFADGQGSGAAEGGSNYLDGLILALST